MNKEESTSSSFLSRRNIAVNLDDEWLVLSASSISADDLMRIANFIGVIEKKK